MDMNNAWEPDESIIEDVGNPYIENKTIKEVVNVRDMLGKPISYDNIIIPKIIKSKILEDGDIILGQSPDGTYVGSMKQVYEDGLFSYASILRKTIPYPYKRVLYTSKLNSPLRKVAFCMSKYNEQAAFMIHNGSSSTIFQLCYLNRDITIDLLLNIDFEKKSMSKFISLTEKQALFVYPSEFKSYNTSFKPIYLITTNVLPHGFIENKCCKVLKITDRYYAGSFCKDNNIIIHKKTKELPYFRTKQVNPEFYIIHYSPDLSFEINNAVMSKHPELKNAEVADFVGDLTVHNDECSIYVFHVLYRYKSYHVYTTGNITVYSPLHVNKVKLNSKNEKIRIQFKWIKKLPEGYWTINRIEHGREGKFIRTIPEDFSSSYYYADLTKNKTLNSILPWHGSGVEYTLPKLKKQALRQTN